MEERIQKIIASIGICSRRKAEQLIIEGKVQVNGVKAKIGEKADLDKDNIIVNEMKISGVSKKYYMLNKPKEVLVTKSDPKGRKTVYSLESVRKLNVEVMAVGRLDMMSEGLLILTNDGNLANRIMHPRYNLDKTYYVRVDPEFKENDLEEIKNGVMIEGERSAKAGVKKLKKNEIELTIHEGRNRIIRKMMDVFGYKVYCIKRIKIGRLLLGDLGVGEVRELKKNEIELLLK